MKKRGGKTDGRGVKTFAIKLDKIRTREIVSQIWKHTLVTSLAGKDLRLF